MEYQLDDFAEDLKEFMSESEIVDKYKMGLYAIEKIEGFVKEFENHCNFAKRPSLMYTPNIFNSKKLEKEFDFRVKNRFNENGIDEKLAQKKYKKLEKHLYKLFPNIKDQIKLNSNFVEVLEPQITTLV